jgi:hypothetical protein
MTYYPLPILQLPITYDLLPITNPAITYYRPQCVPHVTEKGYIYYR